ncbi:MAG: type II toxin-antitoxin system CcdA family antitoxin [Sulfuricella sp.]|nr:type II toxin-antitoxin system CcdA family antitoxin [Sulfuricella sp.]
MLAESYDPEAPKKPTNLSINSDLLRQAKACHINLSQTLEQRLAELVRESRRQEWLQENQAALVEYNSKIETRGVYSDNLRRF